MSVIINGSDLRTLLFCTFRYCLGRKNYVVADAVELLIDYWDNLYDSDKIKIKQEIEKAILDNQAGMDMDVKEWRKVLSL